MKVAIITGGSSGIGRCVAGILAEAGCRVYEFSRHEKAMEGVGHFSVDVTDEAQVNAAVQRIFETEGKIDILVNAAGMGISGAIEFTKLEDAKLQFDVNFFGMANTNKAVLGIMRKAGKGRIINISSVAGPIPIPFQAYYSACKAAVNSYTCALANEVAPYGISVAAVMPGDSKTGFTASRKKSVEGDAEYGGRISRSVGVMEKDEINGTPPETVARYIVKIALKKKVKPEYAAGFTYKLFCVIMKMLPLGLSNKMIGMIYSK